MSAPAHRARTWFARLAPYVLTVAALPLLAPTCGGQQPGPKAFSKGSLIIPMDACYQNTPTTLTNATYFTPYAGCPSNGATTSDHGNVLRAYGLVYQLLRNNIPVYWVINSQKSPPGSAQPLVDTAHPDISVSSPAGGTPVGKYTWAGDTVGGLPGNVAAGATAVSYHGGPFVVDGSDAAAARAVMQSLRASFQTVNVHVSNVAFGAEVARAMSGNFSNSGGSVAPPIALLNITGGDNKNSEVVIQGYLVDAGLGPSDFAGAGGTATANGHGKIYDDLYPADFLPATCTSTCANGSTCTGGRCASNLVAYGYSILWVPHWCGPNSASVPAGYTYLDILTSIRAFMNAGHDVMAECASLGTFEGVNNSSTCSSSPGTFDNGTHAQATQVQTTTGVNINENSLVGGKFLPALSSPPGAGEATFATPFLQIGDFTYTPITGAIQQFSATAAYATRPAPYQHQRLIADSTSTTKDYFTWLPAYGGAGNVVYLAGHDFSGGQGATAQIGGSRLVLNTLFNLGNACTATHAPCQAQGALGVCRNGTRECCTQADVNAGSCQNVGDPFCKPGSPQPETCNGLDDDCDGIVDNHLTDAQATVPACYPNATAGCTQTSPGVYACLGVCQVGTWSCSSGAWTCVGAVTPSQEICNGLDDNCNGQVDEASALVPPGGTTPGQTVACYTGPAGTAGVGLCKAGSWACQSATWVCNGQVLPQQERCEGELKDYNCNGVVGDGCDCVVGTTHSCYTGPAGTAGIGECRAGVQSCVCSNGSPDQATCTNSGGHGQWTNPGCTDQKTPVAEVCGNGKDDDCNGIVDDPNVCNCKAGDTLPCYPSGTPGCTQTSPGVYACTGVCAPGVRVCVAGRFSDVCQSAITPAAQEKCDGKNDTCSGSWTNDDGAPCPAGQACVNGVCTRGQLGGEGTVCQAGYQCQHAPTCQANDLCVPIPCPSSPCAAGSRCITGACVDPCAGVTCGEGAYCSGGACVGGGCTGVAGACTGGALCRNGSCQSDPCASATCPAGTFCRGNFALSPPVADCVRPCAAVTCPYGQACGPDGFCAPDPCATVSCPAGQACKAGACIPDPCPAGACGAGQMCTDGICSDDPCDAIVCPTDAGGTTTVGVCVRGQCQGAQNLQGYGPAPTPKATTSKSGCGCGGGDAAPTSLLLGLLALPLARRRPRRSARGAGLAAAALLLALATTACSKSKTETQKPNCQTCGGDSCVILATDPGNCGSCGRACGSGYACGDGKCLSAAAVPTITDVSPGQVSGTAALTVTGTGFVSGAKVRVAGAVAARAYAATFGSASQLNATVDLSAATSGTVDVQVQNPDGTISNTVGITVGSPTPTIATVCAIRTPPPPTCQAQGTSGTLVPVLVTGTNFTSSSVCIQRAGGVETALPPDARTLPTQLTCTLDLSGVAPGFIDLLVQNANGVRSPAARFEATDPGAPVALSLSPNSAQQGSELKLVVTGTSFSPASLVQIGAGAPGTSTTWTALPTDYVYSTSLRATLSLKTYAAGSYQVRVSSPGGNSSALLFTVGATAPVATLLTVTPTTPVVGQTGVQLSLTGDGFSPGCVVQVQPPGGGFRAADTPGAVTASTVQASADLDQPGDTFGTWNARASCASGCGSPPCLTAALPFAVATNQASLLAVSPAGAEQGSVASVTLAGGNFLSFPAPGMAVTLDGGPGVAATVTSPTSATASLSLVGANTGVHLLRALNAGAAASNPIAFSVTPGTPTVSAISVADADAGACTPASNCAGCSGAGCGSPGACAVQQVKKVLVTLTGTNFGTGVSTVFVTSALTGKVDLSTVLAPGSIVIGPATIRVTLATTAVLAPQTYGLTVENPGKSSGALAFKVSSTTCP